MTKLSILFQNKDFIAVDKPAGISVHNNEDPLNLIKIALPQLKVPTLSPVHRLDKETSGIQILAFNNVAARKLAEEFQNKNVKKTYVGVMRGHLKTPAGVWNQPLSDKAEGRKNPAGLAKNKVPCETRFNILKASKYFTMCEFDLITGRQHQIRKHAAIAEHALLGDPRYGDEKYNKKMAELYKTTLNNQTRMFLHCSYIEISGQKIECAVPKNFETLFSVETVASPL